MVNESSGLIGDIDTGEQIRKDSNKVTEQDVKRVQSDGSKAQKVQDEIKKTKRKNNDIANFLSYLLKEIKNEEIVSAIYNTFFKVVNPKTKVSYLRKSTNNILIIGFFAPFFWDKIIEYKLDRYFDEILHNKSKKLSFYEYIYYIKSLSKKYHDQIPINKKNLINLLSLIMGKFNIIKDHNNFSSKEKIEKELAKK